MKVLLINQFYAPDIAATAQLCTELAEDLAARGHAVTVVCGTARYRTAHRGRTPEPAPALPRTELRRGVRVLRVPTAAAGRGVLGRLGSYASFFGGALGRVLFCERPDVVIALSTPPLLAALGALAQGLRRARFVYWVQDVYPELAIAFGVLREGSAAAAVFAGLAQALYRRADAVIALDEAMADRLIAAGAPPAAVHVIDHFCDAQTITPRPPEQSPLRRALDLPPGAFVVCYAGNHGRGHDFETVLSALRQQAQDPAPDAAAPLHWLFVGDGEQKAPFQAAARAALPGRVHFLPPQAQDALNDVLAAGDAGLITLRAGLAGLMAPSKLYGLLAAGRPVVYVGPRRGRIPELLSAEPVGAAIENGDGAGLLAAVRALRDDPARRARCAATARRLAEDRFDRPRALDRHAALLESLLGGAR